MPLDLSKIKAGAKSALIEPRDIFASLGHRPWPRLRVEQDQVLKGWFERRHERDLVIKQNTGGGKTVVGLLVAQSSLSEGVGPAAYVVPDTYLVDQVVDEANALGIPVTTDPRGADFISGLAILVCTFEKVVNGRSIFGLAGDSNARRIGTVVVDDAHAALAAARKQFTVNVPAEHPAYKKALSIFGDELMRQSYKNGTAILSGDRATPLRIPFWAWSKKHSEVTAEIEASAGNSALKGIFFSWPLLADYLGLAVATISDRLLQLRTPCPPIQEIPAFHLATRRIYLTATLADDGVLVTDLAADPESVRRPITPERATDLGDRLIMAPGALNPNLTSDRIRRLAWEFAMGDRTGDGERDAEPVNVVVLVPSDRASELWSPYAAETLHVGDMKAVVDRMAAGEHLGIVVLVNKYDGVDLPHDACRLLVVDGVPTPLDPGEQREAGALIGSDTYRIRKVQRLEQGMGRGIRDAEDHCAVLLLGSDLALSLVDREDLRLFSPATRAQIDLSKEVAAQIAGEGLDSVREVLSLFLGRDEDWRVASSRATAGVEYDPDGHVSAVSEARRKAWDLAAAGDPAAAATTLRNALDQVDSAERGWRLEEVAAYQHEVSPEDAQKTIKAAKQANTSVLMPALPLAPRPVRGHQQQAVACVDYLSEHFDNGTQLRLGVQSMLDDLAFSPEDDRVDAAEAAVKRLGQLLGFDATRPEKEQGKGPDGCWGLTPHRSAVIELKTGTSRDDSDIIKSETDQLSGAVSWNSAANPDTTECVPVLLARSARLHKLASAPVGSRVVTPDDLATLKADVQAFADEIACDRGWERSSAVSAALASHCLTADQVIQQHSRKVEAAKTAK
ncbi:DEAD/DEAH box helicase [Kribbella albertanoniae]|uniref:DEAD/DEAH box helicase n=1 Tax=Kribbella albertanoniae TaxID=1266829 RepID=A0A4R4QIE2_9ACTN|nr:DEAD/DEAH box helicase [Kribbella albertanoniae]